MKESPYRPTGVKLLLILIMGQIPVRLMAGASPQPVAAGRVFLEGTTSFLNHASATNANITANGGQSQAVSGNPRHGEDGTVRVVRPQVSSLNFTSGTLTINADAGEITYSDGSFLLGEFTDKTYTAENGSTYPYKVTTFTADSINLGSGVVVNVTGNNPLSLRTRNHGNLTLGTTINVAVVPPPKVPTQVVWA